MVWVCRRSALRYDPLQQVASVCAKPKIIRPLSGLVAVSCAVRPFCHTVRDLCPFLLELCLTSRLLAFSPLSVTFLGPTMRYLNVCGLLRSFCLGLSFLFFCPTPTLALNIPHGTDCWIENFQTQPTNASIWGGFHIKKWTVEPVADPATNRTLWIVELKVPFILQGPFVFPPSPILLGDVAGRCDVPVIRRLSLLCP